MDSDLDTHLLLLHTSERTSKTPGQNADCKIAVDNHDIADVDALYVKHITLPNIFDNVMAGMNTISFTGTLIPQPESEFKNDSPIQNITTVVPPGYYDSTTLVEALARALAKAILSYNGVGIIPIFQPQTQVELTEDGLVFFFTEQYNPPLIGIDPFTNKLRISPYPFSSPYLYSQFQFAKKKTQLYDFFHHVCGFTGDETPELIQITDISTGQILLPNKFWTATNPINLSGVTEVLIRSSTLAPGRTIALKSDLVGKSKENILDYISLATTPRGQYCYHQPADPNGTLVRYRGSKNASLIDLQVTDILGRPLFLPDNYHVSLCLLFHRNSSNI